MAQIEYSQAAADLIDRQCRNIERLDFVLDKENGAEAVLKTYDLFNLSRPKKVVWFTDIFNEKYLEIIESASSARSASGASSAWSASSARSARSASSAWSASSACSAWITWSAWSARSAWSASGASSAWSASGASSARSARSASSAWSALDYDFDYYVFEFEYCQNPDEYFPINEHDLKYLEYCALLMQAKEYGVGYRVEFENTLYLVPTPLVRINALNQWHNDSGAAIKWKDSKSLFYYLNGVNFPEKLYWEVVSGIMPFKDILKIENVEQRVQAMRFGDKQAFLKHVKAKQLDTHIKENPNGEQGAVMYTLYCIPQGEIFQEDAYYMVFTDPSTGKEYMEGVEPCQTVAEAMAWQCSITPAQWKALVPLVTES